MNPAAAERPPAVGLKEQGGGGVSMGVALGLGDLGMLGPGERRV